MLKLITYGKRVNEQITFSLAFNMFFCFHYMGLDTEDTCAVAIQTRAIPLVEFDFLKVPCRSHPKGRSTSKE